MYDKRQFQDLKKGEIAGMHTINPVMRFLRNIRSTQSHVHIDGNPGGGIDIAVDVPDSSSSGGIEHTFQGSISSGTLYVTSGSVRFPGATLSASASTFSVTSTEMCYYVECTSSSATVSRASSFPSVLDASSLKVFLPLFKASSDGIYYHHIGDYSFDWLPYFWLSGYDSTKTQVLQHAASGAPSWLDTGVCS